MWEDIGQAWINFDHSSAFFSTNFAEDTKDDGSNILAFKEITTGIGAAVVTAATPIGAKPATLANVLNGVVAGISNALVPPTVDKLDTLAGLQE